MDYIQLLSTIKSSKSQFSNFRELTNKLQEDSEFKENLSLAYEHYFGKKITGCNNCFYDAYIQLNQLDINQVEKDRQCQFRVKRGIIVRDKSYNTANNMSYHTRNDELAIYHLAEDKKNIEYFQQYPDNWLELVRKYQTQQKKSVQKKTSKKTSASAKQ